MNHDRPFVRCWCIPASTAIVGIVFLAATIARADFPNSAPYSGVTFQHEIRTGPNMSLFVVTVDLTNPKVKVRVCPGGDDPDGAGPWETTLMPVSKIAAKEKLEVAVNASFFGIPTTKPIPEELAEHEGKPSTIDPNKSGYAEGRWANDNGVTIADGRHWSIKAHGDWPTIWVEGDRKVGMGSGDKVPTDATAAVSGNVFVLRDGQPIVETGNAKVRHPRTVVGIDQPATKLIILTVDGRQLTSIGMTGTELGQEMKRLGCTTAINLDGGGSTTLVMHDPTSGDYTTVNHPSDGHDRAVADALGISVEP